MCKCTNPIDSGIYCEDRNFCFSNPCLNEGECVNKFNGFSCRCASGWSGFNCNYKPYNKLAQAEINPTSTKTMTSQSSSSMYMPLTSKNNYFTSDCFSYGKQCRNGGQCTKNGYFYTCKCLPNFSGPTCETITDICLATKPCQHGGECVTKDSSFECLCPERYEGNTCEKLKSPCANVTCDNGGVCINNITSNDYYCLCKDNFAGKHCNECKAPFGGSGCSSCANIQFTGVNCSECVEGFSGEACDQTLCSLNPCMNGNCLLDGQGFKCECAEVKFD